MTGDGPNVTSIARRFAEETGFSLVPDRFVSTELGIRRAMARAGFEDAWHYRARLDVDPDLLDALIDELAVTETYFFREPEQFALIRRTILPEIRARRDPHHHFRAWSAGGSTGEEAYSLAIAFLEEGLAGRAEILATDISPAALRKARDGRYRAWSLRGPGADAARPYLTRRGEHYVVADAVRKLVRFRKLNLIREVPTSADVQGQGFDLILCRNVLIYLDPVHIAPVVRHLLGSLAEGGWLITASSDPFPVGDVALEVVHTDAGIVYRRPLSVRPPDKDRLASARGVDDAFGRPLTTISDDDRAVSRRPAVAFAQLALPADSPEACVLQVKLLANHDPVAAERVCAGAAARHRFSSELHYLRGVLLMELGRDPEADEAVRRAIYLDRGLALAHFTLGAIRLRQGDRAGAWQAFRNARNLCASRPPDEIVPLSDAETAGRLARVAEDQMARLTPAAEANR